MLWRANSIVAGIVDVWRANSMVAGIVDAVEGQLHGSWDCGCCGGPTPW